LQPGNAIALDLLAADYLLADLKDATKIFITSHFKQVSKSKPFKALPKATRQEWKKQAQSGKSDTKSSSYYSDFIVIYPTNKV